MKHLLYLIDSFSLGGAETIVVNTLNYINDNYPTINITLVTTVSENGILNKKLNKTITYKHFQCTQGYFFKGIIQLKKYVKENNITHIHSHLYHSIIVGRIVKNSYASLFETYHNLEYNKDDVYYSWWRIYLDRLTFRRGSFSIYVSEDVKQSVERIRKNNIRFFVLNNFAGEEFKFNYQTSNNNNLKLISIGNLKRVKNFIYALEAFKQLKAYPINLDIYGEGPLRTELEKFIKLHNIKVKLMGRQQMNTAILSSYDAFLMTSLNEGMPISLLEALNVGLPCVLPDHLIVMKEVAQNAAKYFSIKDSNSLSNNLLGLLNNKNTLQKMSEEAQKRSKLYSIDLHVSKLMKFYNQ